MAAWIAQNMAPIMFASLVVFLLLGYPVAFSLGACGLFFFIIGVELAPLSGGSISLSWPLLYSMPERIFGVMSNDTLLAIPFFTLMGLILERSGMAEDLLDTIGQLVRHRPRRLGLRRGLRGCAVGGNHGCCGGIGHFDGSHLAADHAALRI